MNTVVGLDIGLSIIGWAVVLSNGKEVVKVEEFGCITTNSDSPLTKRLIHIYDSLLTVFEKYKPEIMAVEGLYYPVSAGVHKYSKSFAETNQARGVIMLAAALNKINIKEFNAKTVKKSVTGYGNAGKQQVQDMIKIILKLDNIPKLDDISDALALAYIGAIE